jgi:hypothetical protein
MISDNKNTEEISEKGKKKVEFDSEGNLIFKEVVNIERGKKSRAQGGQFELRVRHDLEEKGWTVDKWSNNLDLETQKIIPAKKKMAFINRPGGPQYRIATTGTGFPDFIAFQLMDGDKNYKVIGVEVKMNGKLSKIEKDKCKWYLDKKIFSEILVAKKIKEKNRVRVVYENRWEKL